MCAPPIPDKQSPALALEPSMSQVQITMCVCRGMPFERLLALARREGWDLASLIRETGCGGQCGLCRPYLRRMLESGETVFRQILTE